jgi:hypothetical protein
MLLPAMVCFAMSIVGMHNPLYVLVYKAQGMGTLSGVDSVGSNAALALSASFEMEGEERLRLVAELPPPARAVKAANATAPAVSPAGAAESAAPAVAPGQAADPAALPAVDVTETAEAPQVPGSCAPGAPHDAPGACFTDPAAPADPQHKRVVSYGFYGGDSPRYSDGLLFNARALEQVFPGWYMRIYYDSSAAMHRIEEAKAISKMIEAVDTAGMNVNNRMSWRFLALEDPTVERFVARDCDSHLTPRDKSVVDAWVKSGKKFHVVRDHPSHSNYPMSGGMWGAVRGALPDIKAHIHGSGLSDAYLVDMNFLTTKVWPIAQKDVLQHDAFSCGHYGGGMPVPRAREGGEHLGAVYIDGQLRAGDVGILLKAKRPEACTPPDEFKAWSTDAAAPTV